MRSIDTRQFKNSHGKQPKGFGYYLFQNDNGQQFQFRGTYGDAKKQALKALSGNISLCS